MNELRLLYFGNAFSDVFFQTMSGLALDLIPMPKDTSIALLCPLKGIVSSQAKFLELQINFDAPIAEIVHQHHERLDGSGYPNGLVGDQILLEAQVIAVADTIEAMSSHRPYRAGLGIDAALKEVSDHVDTRYNSLAVSAALRLFQEQDFRFQEI